MDETTRGFIEKKVDNIMQQDILQYVSWIGDEIPMSSVRDAMIGYLVGTIEAMAEGVLYIATQKETTKEDDMEIRALIKRRLLEIAEKVERELGR